jgi:predicted RNA-binding Zn ribbon-like protein
MALMDLLCLEFVNSEFREFRGRWVRDDLRQPEWLASFLEKWHLQGEQSIDEAMIEELVALRTLLVRVVAALNTPSGVDPRDLSALNDQLRQTAFHYQVAYDGLAFAMNNQPLQRNLAWVKSSIVVDFLSLLTHRDPRRLKVCRNPHCRGIFYDETKSRTRRYCTLEKCANLMKVRRFRSRHKA